MHLRALLAASLSSFVLLACPSTGVICRAGTIPCGQGCVDPQADHRNCGGCGIACGAGQRCGPDAASGAGRCECQPGSTSCGGACVVLASDAVHCGACGRACGAGQVCEAGACKAECTLGVFSRCGAACVDLQRDVGHCGGCGVACGAGQSCRAGRCTFDVVAACFTSGQVVGVQAGSEARGPREDLGTGPAALAVYGDTLLAADGIDRRLYRANLKGPADVLKVYATFNRTGAVPNQVLVDPPHVYVVNAESGTLQVLLRDAPPDAGELGASDAGLAGGLSLGTIAELPLGANTWPQGLAKAGDALWIPLYGGFGSAAAAGQKVVRVSVANPAAPAVTDTVDLTALDLRPFDGGAPVPRPWAVAAHQGAVYVALNNLNPNTYVPEGPGLLARIDVQTKQATVVDLGADACLNPQWLASDGERLVVSCAGLATYDVNYALVGTEKAGLVLVAGGARAAAWAPTCPAAADGGAGCAPVLPGRFALSGGRVYLGDQNAGRLFVLDVSDAGFGERRGYLGDAGAPVEVCAPDVTTGVANVSDVLAVP